MITTSRFLGYDKNEYGDLIVNRKEAEIVSLAFDLYLMNVGSSRIGELLDYLGVKTVTGTTWESGTINGMLCNEKYKGDFHLQKYYTPENKRNHTEYSCAMKSYFRKFGNQSSGTRKSSILCLITYPFLLGYWSRPCRICGA